MSFILLRQCIGAIVIYVVCLLFVLVAFSSGSILSTVGVMKFVSLMMMLCIGLILLNSNGSASFVYFLNVGVLIFTAFCAFFLLLYLIDSVSMKSGAWPLRFGNSFLSFIATYIDYVSLAPVYAFGAANAMVSFFPEFVGAPRETQSKAKKFFYLADLPCMLPMLFVIAIGAIFGANNSDGKIFLSGAIAMLIVTSNILSVIAENDSLNFE